MMASDMRRGVSEPMGGREELESETNSNSGRWILRRRVGPVREFSDSSSNLFIVSES
jgi:hypothetical protein